MTRFREIEGEKKIILFPSSVPVWADIKTSLPPRPLRFSFISSELFVYHANFPFESPPSTTTWYVDLSYPNSGPLLIVYTFYLSTFFLLIVLAPSTFFDCTFLCGSNVDNNLSVRRLKNNVVAHGLQKRLDISSLL